MMSKLRNRKFAFTNTTTELYPPKYKDGSDINVGDGSELSKDQDIIHRLPRDRSKDR
jgi:hypothetical protein